MSYLTPQRKELLFSPTNIAENFLPKHDSGRHREMKKGKACPVPTAQTRHRQKGSTGMSSREVIMRMEIAFS
jgi:hypothetical protein